MCPLWRHKTALYKIPQSGDQTTFMTCWISEYILQWVSTWVSTWAVCSLTGTFSLSVSLWASQTVILWQTELLGQMAVKHGPLHNMRPTEAELMQGMVWWPIVWANCCSSLRCWDLACLLYSIWVIEHYGIILEIQENLFLCSVHRIYMT